MASQARTFRSAYGFEAGKPDWRPQRRGAVRDRDVAALGSSRLHSTARTLSRASNEARGMKAKKSRGDAKAVKSLTARKAPEATDSPTAIDDWIRGVMPDLNPIVKRLDALIRETIPGLHYAVKWKKAYYGLPEQGWIIELVAYDVSVNVVFFGGSDFDPPPPLGTGWRSRYVKLKTLEEAEEPLMRKWIKQAGRVSGWK
jgi:hypothetical protein